MQTIQQAFHRSRATVDTASSEPACVQRPAGMSRGIAGGLRGAPLSTVGAPVSYSSRRGGRPPAGGRGHGRVGLRQRHRQDSPWRTAARGSMALCQRGVHPGAVEGRQGAVVVSQGGHHDRTVRSGYTGRVGAGFRGGQPSSRAGPVRYGGGGAAVTPLLAAGTAQAAPALHLTADSSGAPPVQGLHLTFGADPRTQMTVSWLTDRPVTRPQVHYGTLQHGFGSSAEARTVTYVDGTSGRTVYVHHAALERLRPGAEYIYLATHAGATPDSGTFRTAPHGRQPFTFTSFGDQSAPQVTWAANGTPALDANSTPATKDIVTGVEQVAPLFHLLNGDLCYANLDVDRVRTWNNFFTNNTRSARFRPWMPAAGNHEIEKANGPLGLGAYQTYFALPSTETDPELAGLWYAFTVGSVRVIVLQNDDNCLQDGGDVYISGYLGTPTRLPGKGTEGGAVLP